MFCKKLCYDIIIRLVTINFQRCIPYSITPCTVEDVYTARDGTVIFQTYDSQSVPERNLQQTGRLQTRREQQ
jgi:hypothetical protein